MAHLSRQNLIGYIDIALFLTVVFGTVLGQRIFPFFLAALMLRYIIDPGQFRADIALLGRSERFLLAAFALMTLYFSAVAAVQWTPYDPVLSIRPRGLEHPGEWIALGAIAALTFLRFFAMQDLQNLMNKAFLPALMVSFGLAVAIYIALFLGDDPDVDRCRTGLASFNTNILAFVIAIITGLGFAYFLAQAPNSFKPWVIIGLGAFFLLFLTISRMAVLSFALTQILVACLMPGPRLKTVAMTIGLLVVGYGLATGLIESLGCGVLDRFNRLADIADAEQSRSTARRFDLWFIALDALQGHWMTGLGFKAEAALSNPNAHIHNQYLSWLIWAGVPGLLVGLSLFVSLLIYGWQKAGLKGFVIAGSVIGFAGANLVADSILYFASGYIHFLILFAFAAGVIGAASNASN